MVVTDFKKGDLVRVTITDTVCVPAGDIGTLTLNNGYEIDLDTADRDGISVEKIEPSVEVFKPGDVVRHKVLHDYHFALYEGGYVDLRNGINNPGVAAFTSDKYEKVNLG